MVIPPWRLEQMVPGSDSAETRYAYFVREGLGGRIRVSGSTSGIIKKLCLFGAEVMGRQNHTLVGFVSLICV